VIRVKCVARSSVPRPFKDSDMSVFAVPMRTVHHVRREFDTRHVNAGLGRRRLSAMAVREVFPAYFVGCDPDETLIIRCC
jgi:hypothetical protein